MTACLSALSTETHVARQAQAARTSAHEDGEVYSTIGCVAMFVAYARLFTETDGKLGYTQHESLSCEQGVKAARGLGRTGRAATPHSTT